MFEEVMSVGKREIGNENKGNVSIRPTKFNK